MPAQKKTISVKKVSKLETAKSKEKKSADSSNKQNLEENTPETLTAVPEIQEDSPLKLETAPVETSQIREEEIPIERKNRISYLLGIGFLATVFTATSLIFIFYNSDWKKQKTLTLTLDISPSPLPTSIPAFNPQNWSVEILNGSGRGGVAKDAAGKINLLGFPIASISNAANSKYKGVSVYLSSSLSPFENQFMEKIKSVYPDASVSGMLNEGTNSARIIIGTI